MAGVDVRNFDAPDVTRTPDKTTLAILKVGVRSSGGRHVPGWRWSEVINPIVGTDDCRVHRLGVVLSGRMHIVHRDGSEGRPHARRRLRHPAGTRRMGSR